MEGAKWWPNDCNGGKQDMPIWPWGEGGWQFLLAWGGFSPVPRENPGCNNPNTQMETMATLSPIQDYPINGQHNQSIANQSLPFNVRERSHSSSNIHPIYLVQLHWFCLERFFFCCLFVCFTSWLFLFTDITGKAWVRISAESDYCVPSTGLPVCWNVHNLG